ncbi:MAG: hypothetical protein R3C49_26400 [Planctomycetaceae bacterium]
MTPTVPVWRDLRHWIQALWLTVFVFSGLVVMSRNTADPDLWGHVTYGREVLRDGYLHPTTTWSYAVDNYRWVNHENIAELMMAAADAFGGQTALLLLKSSLTLIVLGLPIWAARRQNCGLLTCLVLIQLIALNLSFHWLVRPHMLSYACGSALMAILATQLPGAIGARPNSDRFSRWLWLIVPLMVFWTNAHGGYLAGLAILTAWLGLDAAELLIRKDARFRKTVLHHSTLLSVTAAACLLNPYGLELHTWMLSSLGRPRPEIDEWAPLPLLSLDGMPFWGIVLGGYLCLRKSDQPIRWPGMIVLALLTWQAVKHHRHLPFVAMLAAYLLAPHIHSALKQLQTWFAERVDRVHGTSTSGNLQNSPRWTGLLLPMALTAILACMAYPGQAMLKVEKDYYPVSAMQFMADRDLHGKVFVTFNWAQYALAVFADGDPASRIAFDGRFRTCYPQNIIDLYFDFTLGNLPPERRYRETKSGPFDPLKALEFRQPDLVLFERERQNCIDNMMAAGEDWCLLYQDQLAQLWGRSSLYNHPSSPHYLPPSLRHISDDVQAGVVAWPGFPQRRASESVVRRADSIGRHRLALNGLQGL